MAVAGRTGDIKQGLRISGLWWRAQVDGVDAVPATISICGINGQTGRIAARPGGCLCS